jgi:ferrochelatase
MDFIERWGTMPALVEALATRVASALTGLEKEKTLVIFSAHSLPERVLAGSDPYESELMATSRLVSEKANVPNWTFGFQSASSTGEPWIGPDILDVIRDQASKQKKLAKIWVWSSDEQNASTMIRQ